MITIKYANGKVEDGKIVCDKTSKEIMDEILQFNVVIIKNLFDKEHLRELRRGVFEWSKTLPISTEGGTNHHNISWGMSQLQKYPYSYHGYNFMGVTHDDLETQEAFKQLFNDIRSIYKTMLNFYYEVTGNNSNDITLNPQFIQYPKNGGFLGTHIHPFEPQKIGFILNLSELGVDHNTGGAYFEHENTRIDTTEQHDIGDMIIFRFNMLHGVSIVDKPDNFTKWDPDGGVWVDETTGDKLQVAFNSDLGRWVLILSVIYS
jgi:hypothetical protein